jgi:hypothetical protein
MKYYGIAMLILVGCATAQPPTVWRYVGGPPVSITNDPRFTKDLYECERDQRMARPGFTGQGDYVASTGQEAAALILLGERQFYGDERQPVG